MKLFNWLLAMLPSCSDADAFMLRSGFRPCQFSFRLESRFMFDAAALFSGAVDVSVNDGVDRSLSVQSDSLLGGLSDSLQHQVVSQKLSGYLGLFLLNDDGVEDPIVPYEKFFGVQAVADDVGQKVDAQEGAYRVDGFSRRVSSFSSALLVADGVF